MQEARTGWMEGRPFISFSCLSESAGIPSMMLKRSDGKEHVRLVPDLRGKHLLSLQKYEVSCRFFVDSW